jgi:hypothetical protein
MRAKPARTAPTAQRTLPGIEASTAVLDEAKDDDGGIVPDASLAAQPLRDLRASVRKNLV